MTRRAISTALGAVLLAASGFAVGAGGSAWRALEARAEPWKKMRVEHEGTRGATTRTRVVLENPALPLQALEVTRGPEGVPELARAIRKDGSELTFRYRGGARPASIEAPGGARAELTYEGGKVRVAFFGPGERALGGGIVTIPTPLRAPLRGAARTDAGPRDAGPRGALPRGWAGAIVREAHAQPREAEAEAEIPVVRHVELALDLRAAGGKDGKEAGGRADVQASCQPFACVPLSPDVPMPGQSTLRVAVTGKVSRAELPKPAGAAEIKAFERVAIAERAEAERALPDLAPVVASLGVTAMACRSLKIDSPVCVPELGKSKTAGAAIHALLSHEVEAEGRAVRARAEALYFVEQARMKLDREVEVEICVSRRGYARTCERLSGRPFGAQPMARQARVVELRRGASGTLEGSFVMTQSDGADCKFSPSPRTEGALQLTFDNEKSTLTATLRADERGTRQDLRCSLGTANMAWSQVYSATLTQSFTRQELESGGKLALRMKGTMSGVGAYSFSNCRTSGGVSANCPAGKSDGYSHPIELIGELDLGAQKGSGSLVVSSPPLPTTGAWRVPAEERP